MHVVCTHTRTTYIQMYVSVYICSLVCQYVHMLFDFRLFFPAFMFVCAIVVVLVTAGYMNINVVYLSSASPSPQPSRVSVAGSALLSL